MSQKISHYAYSEVRNITTTYFEDGSFDTASGDIRPKEEVVEDTATGDDLDTSTEIETGFYKTLKPIPYTDEDGNELGETEVGSTQEVPVTLSDSWGTEGLAEEVEESEIPDVVEVEDEGEGVVTVEEEKTDAEEKTVAKKLVTRKKKK